MNTAFKVEGTEAAAGTITIKGRELQTTTCMFEQAKLQFYPENPRIYSLVWQGSGRPHQSEIYEKLVVLEHVRELIVDIKQNGGLVEPVIVKPETLEVLEGNSRLAAYRHLYSKDPMKWGLIRCTFLPRGVDEGTVFALLGKYHIKGKKDWSPYEQAGFLYRRYKDHKNDIDALAQEIDLKPARIRLLIETFEFMLQHEDKDITHWSHYEELLKSRKIKKAREAFSDFDDMIVKRIKKGEIGAMALRDHLPNVCEGSMKILQKFVGGTVSFDEACEHAEMTGSTNGTYKRLNKFKSWIVTDEVAKSYERGTIEEKKKIAYELNKIQIQIEKLNRKLLKV